MDGNEVHSLDLRGWWRYSHIPTKGEEVSNSFSSLLGGAHESPKPPKDLEARLGGVGAATRRMFNKLQGESVSVDGLLIARLICYKTYYSSLLGR